MSDFKRWPAGRFPLVFHDIARELPQASAPYRVAVETLPWSAASSRLRLFSFLKQYGLKEMAWQISIHHRGDGGSDLLVSCRVKGHTPRIVELKIDHTHDMG